MFSVVSSTSAPHHLKQLREWFVAEWGKVDPFEGTEDDFPVPSPILVTDGHKLLGGLAFSTYPKPGLEETGLWINALLVAPEHRGVGMGSQLVQAAEAEAVSIGARELFVYTEVPELYRKLAWLDVDNSGEWKVLRRTLANS